MLPGLDNPETTYSTKHTALIIGAGLAGCAIARELSRRGFNCTLYDRRSTPCSETSSVPVALYRPHVTRKEQPATRYFSQAFEHLTALLNEPVLNEPALHEPVANEPALAEAGLNEAKYTHYHRTGVLQLVKDSNQWPDSSAYCRLTKIAASERAGSDIASDALWFKNSGWLEVKPLCDSWISNSSSITYIGNTQIHSLRKTEFGWQLLDKKENPVNESELVVIASAETARQLSQTAHIPLQLSRGQISRFVVENNDPVPKTIISGKGSIIPTATGFWAGSTHQRDDNTSLPTQWDNNLNLRNSKGLCPAIEAAFASGTVAKAERSWVGFRYSTPDRLPVVGGAPVTSWYRNNYRDLAHGRQQQKFPVARFHDGLYLQTGFGSRGVLHSAIAAETLADIISGTHQDSIATSDPDDHKFTPYGQLLHPGRFLIRQLRRGLLNQH